MNDSIGLILRAQAGDEEAFCEAVRANLPLVKSISKRFSGMAEPDDLIQTGSIGLIKAVRRFDPSVGTVFSTYAYSMITGEIRRSLRVNGRGKEVPLEAGLGRKGGYLHETLYAVPDEEEAVDNMITVRQMLFSLPERERELITLRYLCGLTQKAAGERLRLSQPQVSRIEKKTLARLRELEDR